MITPYLRLTNCKEAIEFYKHVFNAKEIYVMLGNEVEGTKQEDLEKVFHAEISVNGTHLMMSEDYDEVSISGIELALFYRDKNEMNKVFELLRPTSVIIEELGKTFWGAIFGRVKDQFGVTWQFSCNIEEKE